MKKWNPRRENIWWPLEYLHWAASHCCSKLPEMSNLKRGNTGFGFFVSWIFYVLLAFLLLRLLLFYFYSYRRGEPVVGQDCWAHGGWEGKRKRGRQESEVPIALQGADPSHSKVSHASFCSPLSVLEITVSIKLALNPQIFLPPGCCVTTPGSPLKGPSPPNRTIDYWSNI